MRKNMKILIVLLTLLMLGFTTAVVAKYLENNDIKTPIIGKINTQELYIYDGDKEGEDLVVGKIISVYARLSTEEKIEKIINELKKKFNDIDLEINGYKNIANKKVLILNLKDKNEPVEIYLNEGSTGSRINLGIIVNSILQNEKNIKNWIDGVKILVNGEENVEGEHVTLAGVFYKSEDNKIELQ